MDNIPLPKNATLDTAKIATPSHMLPNTTPASMANQSGLPEVSFSGARPVTLSNIPERHSTDAWKVKRLILAFLGQDSTDALRTLHQSTRFSELTYRALGQIGEAAMPRPGAMLACMAGEQPRRP